MSQYIDPKIVDRSYRPRAGTMSPGLQRAREPYRIRNALTGLALGAFAVGVWAYSISAVKQDVFDDVDEEARAMARSGTLAGAQHEESKALTGATSSMGAEGVGVSAVPSTSVPTSPGWGLLRHLDARFPWLLDPERKTLVWGAPPIDNLGKLGDRKL